MPLPDAKEIGKRIRAYREFRGWSQARLAGAAGLDPKTISELEDGRPSQSSTIQRIAPALGIKTDDLLGEGPPPLRYYHRLAETRTPAP
jgi:transcriptional regulator with XRE-family HTH domain